MKPLFHHSQLRAALEKGHCEPGTGKLGLEFEQFILDKRCNTVSYFGTGGVEEILKTLQERTGWEPYLDQGHLVALTAADGRAITLEPGGQIEFGSTPCADMQALNAEVAHYRGLLAGIREDTGYCFLALGANPSQRPDEIRRLPKSRYDYMEPWLQEADELGIWMMKTTAGVQVNFDHYDEADAMRKLRAVYMLAPVFNAMFANSLVRAGELSGFMSWRGHVWTKTDNSRCGIFERFTKPGCTFDDYIEWMLDIPMLFLERGGKPVDKRGQSFRAMYEAGEVTEADWDLHLSTPFPEVRFRPQVELRCADAVPPHYALALTALVEGLFYDDDALKQAIALTEHWNHGERLEAWHQAHRSALAGTTADGKKLLDYARELLHLAKPSATADPFLDPLRELLDDGRSLAERTALELEGGGQIGGADLEAVLSQYCCAYTS
ncbi:MAG: glutamate-cysteine ligase family protein [Planctomycetota bacterium]|jgi:glutamate--cysteine ligase|nr:glutamate-cysteine ligase family protein [Planctomycetota bacterium]